MKGLEIVRVLSVVLVGWMLRDGMVYLERQGMKEVVLFDSLSGNECHNHHGMKLEIVPMEGKSMGAHVYGFDPQIALNSPAMIAGVLHALEKHLVLVFHNVSDKMTPHEHVRFAKMFGPVDPEISSPPSYLTKGKFNSPDQVKRALSAGGKLENLGGTMLKAAEEARLGGFPRELTRIVKEPGDLIAFGEGWHSDLTYRTGPPFAAILVSRQLPSTGGNTWFCDMRQAFARLPEGVKDELRTLRANHTDGHDLWSSHPVVRHDNKFGFESLFVNKAFTRHIVATSSDKMEKEEHYANLLERLFQHIENMPTNHPDTFLDLSWESGQMLMWDNRFTQHAAQGQYSERREMHRAIVSGTVPF